MYNNTVSELKTTKPSKIIYTALNMLKNAGDNGLPVREILKQMPDEIELTNDDKAPYDATGYIGWQSILHFKSIHAVKTGFLVKQSGVWYLTMEGKEALDLGEVKLMEAINEGYKAWKAGKAVNATPQDFGISANSDVFEFESSTEASVMTLEQAERMSHEGIKNYINSMNPYKFQHLVSGLLRGMGYYTPFISPPGKDGGVDILAYKDHLGAVTPRTKVQVKHKNDASSANDIRQLSGLLHKGEETGLFVSTGGFTKDAVAAARSAQSHIELYDLDKFVSLWIEFYPNMSDNDKALLPLKTISFLRLEE